MHTKKRFFLGVFLILTSLTVVHAQNQRTSFLQNGFYFITLYAEGYDRLIPSLDLLDNAATNLMAAISEGEDVAESLLMLGLIHQKQGEHKDALAIYRQFASLNPDQGFIYVLIGDIEQYLGETSKALASYQRALSYDEFAMAYAGIAWIQRQHDQIDQAIATYIKSLELAPDYLDARIELGTLYYTIADLDEALEQFELANRYNSQIANVHYYLGRIFYAQAEQTKAIHAFERALQLDPEFTPAQTMLNNI